MSVGDIFAGNGLIQWWKNPTQFFGQNGEMGTDYSLGGTGLPVGAITGGQVIYVGAPYANDPAHSSLGYVVQVLSPDGHVYHYQHLESPLVSVNDTIGAGTPVGLSGGCAVGHYGADGQCTPNNTPMPCLNAGQDCWSSGPHIEVRVAKYIQGAGVWSQPWFNPHSYLVGLGGSNPTALPPSSGGGQQTSSSSSGQVAQATQNGLISFAQRAGIFIGALVLVLFGAFLLFKPQVEGAVKKGIEVAA